MSRPLSRGIALYIGDPPCRVDVCCNGQKERIITSLFSTALFVFSVEMSADFSQKQLGERTTSMHYLFTPEPLISGCPDWKWRAQYQTSQTECGRLISPFCSSKPIIFFCFLGPTSSLQTWADKT